MPASELLFPLLRTKYLPSFQTVLPQTDVAHNCGTLSVSALTDSTLTTGTQASGNYAVGTQIAVTKTAGYNAAGAGTAGAGTAGTPQTGTLTSGIQAVGAGTDGGSIPNYQEQEENIRRLSLMIKSSIKSMPKPQLEQPQPSSHFEKMRSWLQSDEPALRNEAMAWLVAVQDVEPVFDEYGNPYDFTQIEF